MHQTENEWKTHCLFNPMKGKMDVKTYDDDDYVL